MGYGCGMDLGLKGRAAIITGGNRGIGRAIADVLASEGADVALAARDRRTLERAASQITEAHGVKAIPYSYEARDAASVDRMVAQAAAALGRIDILVNNGAPSGGFGPSVVALSDDEVLENLDAKALAYLRCARATVPYMRNGYGRIINVGGMAMRSARAIPGGMRNAAVTVAAKVMAHDLGRYNIAVTTVQPGGTGTDRSDIFDWQGQGYRRVGARDVAYVVAYLASPQGAALTGESISVSAGTQT